MPLLAESKEYYEEYGRAALEREFPEYVSRIAVGLCGRGSECFGYDDSFSADHDYEKGFCLWLTDEDDLAIGPALSRMYRSLPGLEKNIRSGFAEKSRGVLRISDFYRRYTGSDGAPGCWQQWLSLPSYALAEASNGEVWRDDLGVFSSQREQILHGMPEDVRKKKIASRAFTMAQAGQYNYLRCLNHGEKGAAQLAAGEFVRAAAEMVFLLNGVHMPYYKWVFRSIRCLDTLPDICPRLEQVICSEPAGVVSDTIEEICAAVISELKRQNLTESSSDFLEPHAYSVQKKIENRNIAALHITEG